MISIAVPELEAGILTISPDTYFTLPDGAVVTALVGVVVFVLPESFVQPAIRTQEIRRNTKLETRRFFLFIVLNEQGDYFKKSFYRFSRNAQCQAKSSLGSHPRHFGSLKNTIPPEQVIRDHRSKRRGGMGGTVPSFILPVL
jgi:hypothetical protein